MCGYDKSIATTIIKGERKIDLPVWYKCCDVTCYLNKLLHRGRGNSNLCWYNWNCSCSVLEIRFSLLNKL